ncbi:MAG: efflux RND transporter periplasmic adaptor subunit [Pseudomonadota bacterium]
MIRKIITIAGTAGIFVAFFILISIMGAMRPEIERQEAQTPLPKVFYETVTPAPVTLDVVAQGEVRPQTDITLTTQVAGKIVETSDAFVNGGAFKKGDLLVKIEDADYVAAAATSKARVAQALQSLKLEEAEAELAERDYAELGRDEAPTDLTLRRPQLAQARANYEAAQAEFAAARLNVERTRIRAPFDGRVRERIAGDGQFVGIGGQLGRIFSSDVAEIQLPLTDADLAKLGVSVAFSETPDAPGPQAVLTGEIAGRTHEWRGRVARTSGAIDPTTRQVSAIAVVDDPYGDGAADGTPLPMGLFVTAVLTGRPYDEAFAVQRTALHGVDKVYVVDADDVLKERAILVANAGRNVLTVVGGLAAGDRVVVSPLRGAGAGDKVDPSPWREAASVGASTASSAQAASLRSADDAMNGATQ